jgi:hypothetical protein
MNRYKHGEWREGNPVREHVIIAERVLGHPLPPKAQVHHVNEDRNDNRNCNLVICEDQAYHSLLHRRARARRACGNPNWLKCTYCKQYDDPIRLRVRGKHQSSYHLVCRAAYERARKAKRLDRAIELIERRAA